MIPLPINYLREQTLATKVNLGNLNNHSFLFYLWFALTPEYFSSKTSNFRASDQVDWSPADAFQPPTFVSFWNKEQKLPSTQRSRSESPTSHPSREARKTWLETPARGFIPVGWTTQLVSYCCSVAKLCSLWPPWTVALQTPLSMGILQARILEWVAMPSSRESSQPRDWTQVSCIAGRFFTS